MSNYQLIAVFGVAVAAFILIAIFVNSLFRYDEDYEKKVIKDKRGFPLSEREQYDDDYVTIASNISKSKTERELIRAISSISAFKRKWMNMDNVNQDVDFLMKQANDVENKNFS